jgi:S-adenosylmethionine synthetase
MIGYATNETEEMLPLTLVYATKLLKELALARENNTLPFLASDAKS